MNELAFWKNLTEEQTLLLHKKIWVLLGKMAEEYTAGESSTVKSETANRLLASALFTLREYLDFYGKTEPALLDEDIFSCYEEGVSIIRRKTDLAKALWIKTAKAVPPIPSRSLGDTLKNLRKGIMQYNPRLFSAEIPCSVDYQLMVPIAENLLGIEYITEYLRRLIIELNFIRQFDASAVRLLLFRINPNYKELLINITEFPLQNAMAKILLGKEICPLLINKEEREQLIILFGEKNATETEEILFLALEKLCGVFGSLEPSSKEYLIEFAKSIVPRLLASQNNSYRGVFI